LRPSLHLPPPVRQPLARPRRNLGDRAAAARHLCSVPAAPVPHHGAHAGGVGRGPRDRAHRVAGAGAREVGGARPAGRAGRSPDVPNRPIPVPHLEDPPMDWLTPLADLFLHLDRHLNEFARDHGTGTYLFLFLIVFCETGLVVTPFLPGDSLLFAVGALSAS